MSVITELNKKTFQTHQRIIKRLKREWYKKTARLNPQTIFLLGHPKAGTTVIAALLSKISGKTLISDP
ncbi:MAG: hypothetical protein WA999_00245, partial [Spirulinaceae cyanobacterium]